jgi:hypothetical protein
VGSVRPGTGHHRRGAGRAAGQPARLRAHQAPGAGPGPGCGLGAAGTPAAGLAAVVGAARGSACDLGVPGEHGLGRDPGVQASRIRRVHRPGRGLPAALADRSPERAGHLQGSAAQRLRAVGAGQHVGAVPGVALADGPGRPARLSWRTRGERPPFS